MGGVNKRRRGVHEMERQVALLAAFTLPAEDLALPAIILASWPSGNPSVVDARKEVLEKMDSGNPGFQPDKLSRISV